MPGSTLQLVSYGAQDMYLTGNPQITFFKVVYRRHTNFSMEDIIIDTCTKPKFGQQLTYRISKLGDLVHKVSLIYKAQKVYAGHGLANPTTALINYISLVIGGHEIDRQYGHWMETWYELTKPNHNGTITNMTKIDDNSISHLSSALDIAVATYYKQEEKCRAYFNNRLNKITNTFGSGISYPPTKFQKSSGCGGVYCEPTFLQEIDQKITDTGKTIPGWYADGTEEQNASHSDFSTTVGTNMNALLGDTERTAHFPNGSDMGSAVVALPTPYLNIMDNTQVKQSLRTGSIIGLRILEIPFWFSKDPGLSIPLIAIQNQEIQLDIHIASEGSADWSASHVIDTDSYMAFNGGNSNVQNAFNAFNISKNKLLPIKNSDAGLSFDIDVSVLYIYLDTDERKRFCQISHEYLIEQVQYMTNTSTDDVNINISTFSHPVKELIWTGKPYIASNIKYSSGKERSEINNYLNNGIYVHKSGTRFQPGSIKNICGGSIKNSSYSLGFGNASWITEDPIVMDNDGNASFSSHGKFISGLIGPSTPSCLDDCDWGLSLNDIPRTTSLPLQEFTRYNIERYHSGYGSVSCPDSIAVYSFALKPEDHQPSGTCNFSKIDKVMLHRYKGDESNRLNNRLVPLNIYAINYNILRIMSGMCGIAYTL